MMDGKDIILKLRRFIETHKEKNVPYISLAQLEDELIYVEKHASQCHEKHLESYRAVISTGANAIKASVLINGGAAIALLTFYAKAKETIEAALIGNLTKALFFFGVGVFIAALGSGFAYFTNRAYLEGKNKLATRLNIISAALILSAYICFLLGITFSAIALGLFS